MPKLKELVVDFEQSDPLVYNRTMQTEVVGYDPILWGLTGFKTLSKIDVRGVSEGRLNEIATVVAACIASKCLKTLNMEIEKWWSVYMEEIELDDDTDLWDWIEGIWDKTIGRARIRPGTVVPTIDVNISLINIDWEFRTHTDFSLQACSGLQKRITVADIAFE